MKRSIVACTVLALLAACSAQTDETTASDEATAEPAAAPEAEAVPTADLTALEAGDVVLATKQTQCHEVGENADEQPWDVGEGSFATVVEVQGDQILVELAGTQCLIPADAVKPSEG